MPGINYHYSIDEEKGLIKLKPTKRSILAYSALVGVFILLRELNRARLVRAEKRAEESIHIPLD